jgi:hypothetical protein
MCPSRCYLTFFHIPERSIALVKRLAGSPKGAEIDPNLPHANKSVTPGSTRILIYMDGLFQSHQTVPKLLFTFFHIPERSIGNDWLVHQKELKLIQPPTLTKVLPKVAHAFLYIDGSFRTKLCPCYLTSSIFLNVQLH